MAPNALVEVDEEAAESLWVVPGADVVVGLGAPLLEAEEVLEGAGELRQLVGLELGDVDDSVAAQGELWEPELPHDLGFGVVDLHGLLPVEDVYLDPRHFA